MKTKVIIMLISSLLMAPLSYATSIDLTGTVRDFTPATNADFGPSLLNYQSSENRGIVEVNLGADGKPVYAHGESTRALIHGATSFNQWYNNNTYKADYTITLNETFSGSGVYSYSSNNFFPIDGQLLGNYANYGHNYHFTYEIHSDFTYKAGQVFSFSGDDDVWVFINKKLAIDLGGIHGATPATVRLDSLGLTEGNVYDFDFFFAERMPSGSNLMIQTSIKLNEAQPVPEPSTLLLLGLGLIGFGFARRRLLAK